MTFNLAIPYQYRWLKKEPGPKVLIESLKLYDTREVTGPEHNALILSWADEIGGWVGDFYDKDEIPWCGLFVGIVCKRAGFPFNQKLLGALNWLDWGIPVSPAKLWDVLVFQRPGGGHVGFYVGEDKEAYHVYGGNQGNAVGFTRIDKDRCVGARRCPFKNVPTNVRQVFLGNSSALSKNEA